MNNLVAAYASKIKTFSGTLSLKTRVGIATGVLTLGYYSFWNRVFDELGLEMDSVFTLSLKARDTKKVQKRKRQKSTGKLKMRKIEFGKYAEHHQEQMDDTQTGNTYGAGVDLATVKRKGKEQHTATERNPKGTVPECMHCPYYHPCFCTVLGHTFAASKDFFMKCKTKDKSKGILATLKKAVDR